MQRTRLCQAVSKKNAVYIFVKNISFINLSTHQNVNVASGGGELGKKKKKHLFLVDLYSFYTKNTNTNMNIFYQIVGLFKLKIQVIIAIRMSRLQNSEHFGLLIPVSFVFGFTRCFKSICSQYIEPSLRFRIFQEAIQNVL